MIIYFVLSYSITIQDQEKRYKEIKLADLPSAIAARKTREFRCPPQEQMQAFLNFKNPYNPESGQLECPCNEDIKEKFRRFKDILLKHAGYTIEDEKSSEIIDDEDKPNWGDKLVQFVIGAREDDCGDNDNDKPGSFVFCH